MPKQTHHEPSFPDTPRDVKDDLCSKIQDTSFLRVHGPVGSLLLFVFYQNVHAALDSQVDNGRLAIYTEYIWIY